MGLRRNKNEKSGETGVTIPFLALSLKGVSYQHCQKSYAKGHSKGCLRIIFVCES